MFLMLYFNVNIKPTERKLFFCYGKIKTDYFLLGFLKSVLLLVSFCFVIPFDFSQHFNRCSDARFYPTISMRKTTASGAAVPNMTEVEDTIGHDLRLLLSRSQCLISPFHRCNLHRCKIVILKMIFKFPIKRYNFRYKGFKRVMRVRE